ncbi:MAG: hypothetical protein H7096_02935 [Flavobacterium sp.]|nr:hypothetical protein [Pedobacter sp.]
MKFRILIMLTAILAAESPAFAQYATDALRFSQFQQGSSARFKAMGGAQIAVGADIGSLSSNPAGLGLFTKSEANFSADFSNRKSQSNYLGQFTDAQKDRLGIDQAGAVFYNPTLRSKGSDLKTGWLSFNYGLSYNKTNNFNSTVDYSGTNQQSSIADYFSDLAGAYLSNGNPATNNAALPAGSLERMAYNNYLIEYDPAGYFPATSLNNNQQNLIYQTGSQSEVNFGGGANYSNKLYLGASVAFSSLNYNSDREFIETGNNRAFPGQDAEFAGGLYNLSYKNNQITRGSGFNAKLGMIYRATNSVRVGLSFISPTWLQINDSFSEALDTRYTRANGSAIQPYTNTPEIYDLSYTLRTPYKINGGISAIINKQGLISADVEYVDYSSINFKSDNRNTDLATNNRIRDSYKAGLNLRVGAEYKIENVMLRGGYNRSGSPFKDLDFATDILSAGIGLRSNLLYLDLTYQNAIFNSRSTPYSISSSYPDFQFTGGGETANIKNNSHNVFLTVGARF